MYLTLIILSIIFAVIIFQTFILFGAPWGEYTMGGKYPGVIPKKVRYLTIIQILVLLGFAYIIAEKTDLLGIKTNIFGEVGIWFVFAFFVLGTILNWITPSKKERLLWGPVNTLILVLLIILLFFRI